jgi:urease accessory protein
MTPDTSCPSPHALLRLQTWASPAFPIGSYSYSHGLEWAVEAGDVRDPHTLVAWLEADLRHGTLRNEAIFFSQAWSCVATDNPTRLLTVCELATAHRGTAEFALESSQQATAALALLRAVWPDPLLDWLAQELQRTALAPAMAVVLATRAAREGAPIEWALPVYLQSVIANLVTAAVRLIPLGQTAGQRAIADLEQAVLEASAQAGHAPLEDIGSAAFMVELASMAHETQYTRLFRS